MNLATTRRNLIIALAALLALATSGFAALGTSAMGSQPTNKAVAELIRLEAPPVSSVTASESTEASVGAVPAARDDATLDNREEEDAAEEPDDDDRSWRVLGSSLLEKSREAPARGFLKHRMVHFTFDDGPHVDNTPRLLDELAEYGVHATFFIVGRQLGGPRSQERRAIIQRMEAEGHTVAVHTNAHRDLTTLSAEQITEDLERVEGSLEATLGYRPGLFRPPYGRRSRQSNALLRERGYTQVLWNMPPEQDARSSEAILQNFRSTLDRMDRHPRGPGGIIIMHDPHTQSVDAFPSLMDELRRRNCELLDQEGEELWDVTDDLRPFLLYDEEPPPELIEQRQAEIRRHARELCADQTAPEGDEAP